MTSDADSSRSDDESVDNKEEEEEVEEEEEDDDDDDEEEEVEEVEEEVEEDEQEGDGDGEQEEVEDEEEVDEEEQEQEQQEEGGDLTDAVILMDQDPEGHGEQEDVAEEEGEDEEEEEQEKELGDLSDASGVLMDVDPDGYGEPEHVMEEVGVEEEERKEESVDLLDVMVLMDDHQDNIKKPESREHVKDLELVSSISSGSGNNTASLSHCKDGGDGGLTTCYPPANMLLAHKIEVSDNSEVAQVADRDKHISSEENAIPKSSLGGKEIKVLAEGQAFIGDMKGAKSSNTQAQRDQQSHLHYDNSTYGNNEFGERSVIGATIGKSDGLLPRSQMKTELRMPLDLSLTSTSPHRRPRSSSPEITMDNLNKKPALLCNFFARGWCIKGNSCRFLHQKEGDRDLDQKKDNKDLSVPTKTIDILDGTGAKDADRSNLTSSQELSDLPNTDGSSKSKIQIQRALVRAYGGESNGSTQFNDDHKLRIGDESHNVDVHQGDRTFVREEYKGPFGVGPHFDPMDDKRSASELLSRRYLTEGKLQWEVPKRETKNDSSFPRESSLTMSSLVAENRHYSGGPSSSSIYNNINTPLDYDKSLDDLAFRDQQSNLPFQGIYRSYNLTGPLKTSFNSSLRTSLVSQSPYAVSQGAISSAYGSTPSAVEALDIHKVLEIDGGYNGSRSASLPRSSSPYFSRPEAESTAPHSISRVPSVDQKGRIQENSWLPSVPFRPSFNYPLCVSSPGNQYDPLLDSIEPVNKGNITLQASWSAINQNVASHPTNDEHQLYGHHFPVGQRTLSSFPQPYEGTLCKSSPPHGLSGGTALVAALAPSLTEGKRSSMLKEEKGRFPDYLIENTDVNDAEVGGDSAGKGIIVKESKATKFFRAALVEFVKELVKPSWREGHLSKDAHKKIVKKAVEKVLSAIQPHQIPSTAESINQYLLTSRPKILKLVEGYVDKYSKPRASSLLD